ncbi:uncharacterized protein LOC142331806 isoform X2 [Lycorma delicatula]|uniref:uncharacterized protein LOC142331806 isoform X2 n=1 Tax=Lycorma delicatula TaxID=130591 RepID=UPI003F51A4DB
MVYHYHYTHVYRCPFQIFLQTDLNRHFEINESHKTSVRVVEKTRDPVDGSQRILLQTSWKNIIPEPLRQIDNLNVDEIHFEEEFWIDENQQGYWHRCRNVTLDNLLQIWQASTYSKDNDSDWFFDERINLQKMIVKKHKINTECSKLQC